MTTALVIGAGPAGLAVAAELRGRAITTTVVERCDDVGAAWRAHYDRLHLHTARAYSGLPGLAIPRRHGRYVARARLIEYLEAYAAHHGIRPRFGVTAERLDRAGDGWIATTTGGVLAVDSVVVATGFNHTPFVPDWPGRDSLPRRAAALVRLPQRRRLPRTAGARGRRRQLGCGDRGRPP